MKISAVRIFFALLFALCISVVDLLGFEFSERSVSPSGQFIIYGSDAAFRGSISALAERTKADLLSVLKRRDAWKTAIVISLQPRAVNLPEVPPTELRFSQTETGIKLQLDLSPPSREMRPAAIERELARVILLEMIYRNQTGIPPGEAYVEPLPWLVDGLLASAPNRNRTSWAISLSAPARVPTLAEFLSQRPEMLDSSARELYRAYSFALVQALIGSPGERSRLGRYIDNLAFASNDSIADLRTSFPEMPDFESAWKSKIAELSASLDQDLLTFSQTEQKLNVILKFPSDENDESVSLENLSQIRPTPAQRTALQRLSQKLLLLATRANPALRPVIQDYHRIADQLALGKNRGTAKRLTELKSLRARLSARMSDIDDYLNWFEAAKLETPSGLFEDSMETAGKAQKSRRRDPLSIYLDAMELEF